jgi:dihydroorotate dehydrogenase (fumarate)/dihydropyrimidine dehydrogenase (NAD+) subunit PreA
MIPDISIEIYGIKLRNPLMLASGDMGNSGQRCKEVAEAGAGAIVSKSFTPFDIVKKADQQKIPLKTLSPRCWFFPADRSLVHVAYSSPFVLQEWVDRELKIAMQGGVPVIASISLLHLSHRDLWSDYDVEKEFEKVAKMGVAWIEMNEGPPERVRYGSATKESWGDYAVERLRHVKRAVDLPIFIKPSYRYPADMVRLAKKLVDAGADGLVLGTGNEGLYINVETGKIGAGAPDARMNVSGREGFHLWLKIIFEVCQNVKVPVIGAHGIFSGTDVIEQIMAGAVCSQMITCPSVEGPSAFRRISQEVSDFLRRKGYSSLKEVRGMALRPENLRFQTGYVAEVDEDRCNGCGECTMICYGGCVALDQVERGWVGARINVDPKTGKAKVNEELCEGCAGCVSICPQGAIRLRGWN